MGNIVNKSLKSWILPDEDMIRVLNQNMGNALFFLIIMNCMNYSEVMVIL